MGVTVTPEQLWGALREVTDPEIPVSVVDLGLIYDVSLWGDKVLVTMTFTGTACPCMNWIEDDIRNRLLREPGVGSVELNLVWDPPWTADRITPAGREQMRLWGIAT